MHRRLSVLAPLALLTLSLAACQERYPPLPEVWVGSALPTYQPSSVLPPATDEGVGADGSLLESYANRTYRKADELLTWQLPFQAKTMIVELLIAAAKDDPQQMLTLLTENARWGLPDRRELRARPISTHDDPLGLEFLSAFRTATSRFSKKASFTCTPLQPGWQMFAASGAEPVWCSYTSGDNLDIIGFRLIMEGGRLKTDYIGFFPQRQTEAIRVPDAGDPPPLTPYIKRPVDLELPDLMPDGSNPVLEKKQPREQAKPAEPPPDLDAPIPVPARDE
ncbi:MAG TPA: hypothetical protein VM869_12425 [Enhygromyxa sp.]|nr:hypothetical protein [Enhygromyxa sp.]